MRLREQFIITAASILERKERTTATPEFFDEWLSLCKPSIKEFFIPIFEGSSEWDIGLRTLKHDVQTLSLLYNVAKSETFLMQSKACYSNKHIKFIIRSPLNRVTRTGPIFFLKMT